MKRFGVLALLASLAVVAAGCMGGDDDSTARKAAIGSSAPTAADASLSIPAIPNAGKGFKVSSWSWGGAIPVTVASATSGAGAGKFAFGDFAISKNIDNVSNDLFSTLAKGQLIASMTFKVGTALTYTFTTVYVKSLNQSGDGADGNETVAFAYGKLCLVNSAAGPSPNVCWNAVTNAPN